MKSYCQFAECKEFARAKGLCNKHYHKQKHLQHRDERLKEMKEYTLSHKIEKAKYDAEYRIKNKERIQEKRKQKYADNPEPAKKRAAQRRIDNPEYNKQYHAKHHEEQNEKHKSWMMANQKDQNKKALLRTNNRRKTDVQFKLKCNLRCRLYQAIHNKFKFGSAVRDVGCTIAQLQTYLESKFEPWMTWENWKLRPTKEHPRVWHLDHIKPLTAFDLTDRQQFLEACHYTNLQPLEWYKNISKGNRTS